MKSVINCKFIFEQDGTLNLIAFNEVQLLQCKSSIFLRLNKFSQRPKSGNALIMNTKEKMQFLHFSFSPGIAETLVRRGEITNHNSIAYCLSNISAKNYQNLSVDVC